MIEINKKEFQKYYPDIKKLIGNFTISSERTNNVLKKLESYLYNNSALVAGHIIDNHLISFVWCHIRVFGGTERLHIKYFIVDKNYRGKGLSNDLLSYIKIKARSYNISEIDLNVNPDNEHAIKVYEKSGFTAEKIQLVYDIEEDDRNV